MFVVRIPDLGWRTFEPEECKLVLKTYVSRSVRHQKVDRR